MSLAREMKQTQNLISGTLAAASIVNTLAAARRPPPVGAQAPTSIVQRSPLSSRSVLGCTLVSKLIKSSDAE